MCAHRALLGGMSATALHEATRTIESMQADEKEQLGHRGKRGKRLKRGDTLARGLGGGLCAFSDQSKQAVKHVDCLRLAQCLQG